MGVIEARTPRTVAVLAQSLIAVAKDVERINRDTDEPSVLVNRMLADGVDEYVAAFHGLTSAWLQKVFPYLDGLMWREARSYRTVIVLKLEEGHGRDRRAHELVYMLPRAWDYVDDEWSGREVEA